MQRLGAFRRAVTSELTSRSLLDEETRSYLPTSTTATPSHRDIRGTVEPMEVSLLYRQMRDPAAEAHSLRYELNLATDKYSAAVLGKEAAERKVAELQAELDAAQVRHSAVARKLQSDAAVAQSEGDGKATRLAADLRHVEAALAALQKDHDAHAAEAAKAATAQERRVGDLEVQLRGSQAEHAADARRLAEVEGQHKKAADELADLMKRFLDLGAAKVKTDAANSELQEHRQRDAAALADRDARVREQGAPFGPPGNASRVWKVPHIQAHQPLPYGLQGASLGPPHGMHPRVAVLIVRLPSSPPGLLPSRSPPLLVSWSPNRPAQRARSSASRGPTQTPRTPRPPRCGPPRTSRRS